MPKRSSRLHPTDEAKLQADLVELAKKINEARKNKGLTQEELAARAGISVQHVRRIEVSGKRRSEPSASVIARLVKVLARPERRQGESPSDYAKRKENSECEWFVSVLSHFRTQEELVDEGIEDAKKNNDLERIGLNASGHFGHNFAQRKQFLDVVRRVIEEKK